MPRYFAILLTFALAVRADAQVSARITAGATRGSTLVDDDVNGPIALGTAISPTVAVAIAHPVGSGYRALLEVRASRGNLMVDDDAGSASLDGLTALGVMVLVDGPVAGTVRFEIGAGLLSYRTQQRGVFADGRPSPWILGGGLSWSRPLGVTTQLIVNARYDFHQFQSDRLESLGYTRFNTVHRVGLGFGVERRL